MSSLDPYEAMRGATEANFGDHEHTTALQGCPNLDRKMQPSHECWLFEADTYSLALLALVRKGVAASCLELLLATITPCLQFASLYVLVGNVVSGKERDDEEICALVQFICFAFGGVSMTDEVLEGGLKLVFSLRALTGVFKDIRSYVICSLGLILGLTQILLGVVTIALNMRLVATAGSVEGAFMNFVAVNFLVEIDNRLMESRPIQEFFGSFDGKLELQCGQREGQVSRMESDGQLHLVCYVIINCTIFFGASIGMLMRVAVAKAQDPPADIQIEKHLPSLLFVWIATNAYAVCVNAMGEARVLISYISSILFTIVASAVDFGLPGDVLYCASIVFTASFVSASIDPYYFLRWNVRYPFFVWSFLALSTIWVKRLRDIE